MKDLGVNLSDIERARELSRRLTGPQGAAGAAVPAAPAARYVQFGMPISAMALSATHPAAAGAPETAAAPAERAPSPAARLAAPAIAEPVPAPPSPPPIVEAVAAVPSPPPIVEPAGFESLDAMLEWCRCQLDAESAFIVDTQGFVITVGGRAAEDHFEGLGAGLSVTVEHLMGLDEAAGQLKWVDLEYSGRRLVAIRTQVPDHGAMVLGFVAPAAGRVSRLSEVEQVAARHIAALA
ncbi:MAG: hypothetical protein AB1714_12560 [Acidobacteriota bacterium]